MKFVKHLPILSLEEFLTKSKKLKQFKSSLGKRYEVSYILGDVMHFTRLDANTDQDWSFDLNDVYSAYEELEDFTTLAFKKYIPKRHSPARGLLLAIDLIYPVD